MKNYPTEQIKALENFIFVINEVMQLLYENKTQEAIDKLKKIRAEYLQLILDRNKQ